MGEQTIKLKTTMHRDLPKNLPQEATNNETKNCDKQKIGGYSWSYN